VALCLSLVFIINQDVKAKLKTILKKLVDAMKLDQVVVRCDKD
jgi:ribosomal protein S20